MTDETDAVFVERQIQEYEEYVQATGERNAEYERVLEIASAHAAPPTVQAGVTNQGMAAIRELVILIADQLGGLPGDIICDNFPDDEATSTSMVDGVIVPSALTFGHIRRAYAALEAAASALTSAPELTLQNARRPTYDGNNEKSTGSPAPPAACSCGGVAWQPIETAPKSTPILVSYIIAFNEPVTGMAVCWFHHEKWCGGPADILQFRALAWMPLPADPTATPSTPCACYRAGMERAAKIAEDAAFARAIASDIRRAGEEGSQ